MVLATCKTNQIKIEMKYCFLNFFLQFLEGNTYFFHKLLVNSWKLEAIASPVWNQFDWRHSNTWSHWRRQYSCGRGRDVAPHILNCYWSSWILRVAAWNSFKCEENIIQSNCKSWWLWSQYSCSHGRDVAPRILLLEHQLNSMFGSLKQFQA